MTDRLSYLQRQARSAAIRQHEAEVMAGLVALDDSELRARLRAMRRQRRLIRRVLRDRQRTER